MEEIISMQRGKLEKKGMTNGKTTSQGYVKLTTIKGSSELKYRNKVSIG